MTPHGSGQVSYTGDGASGLTLWGQQVEQSPFVTSYIPTSGGTVTRATDIVNAPSANVSQPTLATPMTTTFKGVRPVFAGAYTTSLAVMDTRTPGHTFGRLIRMSGSANNYGKLYAYWKQEGQPNNRSVEINRGTPMDNHITVVHGELGELDLVVDAGTPNHIITVAGQDGPVSTTTGIGGYQGGGSRWYGHLSNIRTYADALSTSQIAEVYEQDKDFI